MNETRLYTSWSTRGSGKPGVSTGGTGIISAKRELNSLHHYMGENGYDQVWFQISELLALP